VEISLPRLIARSRADPRPRAALSFPRPGCRRPGVASRCSRIRLSRKLKPLAGAVELGLGGEPAWARICLSANQFLGKMWSDLKKRS
jgi:hypothetical protein